MWKLNFYKCPGTFFAECILIYIQNVWSHDKMKGIYIKWKSSSEVQIVCKLKNKANCTLYSLRNRHWYLCLQQHVAMSFVKIANFGQRYKYLLQKWYLQCFSKHKQRSKQKTNILLTIIIEPPSLSTYGGRVCGCRCDNINHCVEEEI